MFVVAMSVCRGAGTKSGVEPRPSINVARLFGDWQGDRVDSALDWNAAER